MHGKLDQIIQSPDIWYCTNCYTCYELCPQKFGMVKVFDRLKQLSTQSGTAPPGARDVLKLFLDTGKLGEPCTNIVRSDVIWCSESECTQGTGNGC
jgi:heterodisulfide reductase subunit C